MKVYIDNVEVKCEIPISYTSVKDETFDNANIVIPLTYRKEPYKPRSIVRIETTDESLYFKVVSDNVSLVSRGAKPVYKHTITLVEITSDLNIRLIKNICCYQPAETTQTRKVATEMLYNETLQYWNYYFEPITFSFSSFRHVVKLRLSISIYRINETAQMEGDIVNLSGGVNVLINGTPTTLNTNSYLDLDTSLSQVEIRYNNATPIINETLPEETGSQVVIVYNIEREVFNYTFVDIVNRIREVAMQYVNGERKKPEPFNLINSNHELYPLFNKKAPNFAFTQCSVFEALQQVFLYFDGIPRLLDNGNISIDFFNEYKVENNQEQVVDEKSTINADNYINSLFNDVSNGVLEKTIKYPANNLRMKAKPTVAGKYEDKNIALILPRPINRIKHLWCWVEDVVGINEVSASSKRFNVGTLKIDILPILKTSDEISILPDVAGFNELSKNNTIGYSRGGNEIGVGATSNSYGFISDNLNNGLYIAISRHYGVSSANISFKLKGADEYEFQIEYEPMISTRIKSESLENKAPNSEILSNQASIEPSISKIGRNMFGLTLKYGNEEITRTKRISTFANRYKIGDNYIINGERYIVNNATTTFFNTHIISQATLTKDFNKLSSYLGVDERKRFTNIDRSIAIDSRDVISDYIVYSSRLSDLSSEFNNSDYGSGLTTEAISSMLDPLCSINETGLKADISYFKAISNNVVVYAKGRSMPFICYGLQNSIVFDFAFDDPMSAGIKRSGRVNNVESTTAVAYTKDDGTFDSYSLRVFTANDVYNAQYYVDFPEISDEVINTITNASFMNLYNVIDKKDANEITKLTYQLCFVPSSSNDLEIIFGNEFFENNTVFGGDAKATKVRIYNKYISQFDDDLNDDAYIDEIVIDNINWRLNKVQTNDGIFGIELQTQREGIWETYEFEYNIYEWDENDYVVIAKRLSFALLDENNNLLVAVNNTKGYEMGFNIYFTYSKQRY